jgi:hypothetical protein
MAYSLGGEDAQLQIAIIESLKSCTHQQSKSLEFEEKEEPNEQSSGNTMFELAHGSSSLHLEVKESKTTKTQASFMESKQTSILRKNMHEVKVDIRSAKVMAREAARRRLEDFKNSYRQTGRRRKSLARKKY